MMTQEMRCDDGSNRNLDSVFRRSTLRCASVVVKRTAGDEVSSRCQALKNM